MTRPRNVTAERSGLSRSRSTATGAGCASPIPLFVSLSYKLHQGKATPNDWESWTGFGDGQNEANRLVFGNFDFYELCELPAHDDDPPGAPRGRAARFADYLWSAIEASTEEPT